MKKPLKSILLLVMAAVIVSIAACSKDGSPIVPTRPGDSTKPVTPVADSFQLRDSGLSIVNLSKPESNITQYLQYIPAGYNEKKSYKWPVVFFLHGTGEIGHDANVLRNVGLPKVSAGKQFVIIAPQCNESWWDYDALQHFYKTVIQQYHIDSSRVYLTGSSMGGQGAWTWAILQPAQFAAMVPISGTGDSSQVKVLKKVPVWAFHNADDPTVNVNGSRMMVAALKAAGGNVKYTENPTGGHDAWTEAYASADLYTWLLAQKKP